MVSRVAAVSFYEGILLVSLGIFTNLIHFLKQSHYYEYKMNSRGMFAVQILLFILSPIQVLYLFYRDYLKKHYIILHISRSISYLGTLVLSISYIFIYVKPSKDPLEGISKLDAFILISRNQVKIKSDKKDNQY